MSERCCQCTINVVEIYVCDKNHGDDGWNYIIELYCTIGDCTEPYLHSISIYGGMWGCPCYGSSEGPEASEYLETQEWIRFAWWLPLDVNRGDCWIRGRYRSMATIWLG